MHSCLLITFARHTLLEKNIKTLLRFTNKLYIYQNRENDEYREQCYIVTSIIKKLETSNIIYFRPKIHLESEESIKFAITEFFQREEFGIILEDDCSPVENLFHFNNEVKKQSKLPNRFVINGFNPLPNGIETVSIQRNVYLHVWGWATNAQTWNDFLADYEIKSDFSHSENFKKLSLIYRVYWVLVYELVKRNKIKSWDYKFQNFLWRSNIAIFSSSENFVHNLGADEYSTFLKKDESNVVNIKANDADLKFLQLKSGIGSGNKVSKYHYRINIRRVVELVIILIKNLIMKN